MKNLCISFSVWGERKEKEEIENEKAIKTMGKERNQKEKQKERRFIGSKKNDKIVSAKTIIA